MAQLEAQLEANDPANFFVDAKCINCGACRHDAPAHFGATGQA